MMTNEAKAKEIAGYKPDEKPEIPMFQGQDGDKYACYESAMAMADFKDAQPISELGGWHTEPPTEDCKAILETNSKHEPYVVASWSSHDKCFYDSNEQKYTKWKRWKRI